MRSDSAGGAPVGAVAGNRQIGSGESGGRRPPDVIETTPDTAGAKKHGFSRWLPPALAVVVGGLLLLAAQDLSQTIDYRSIVKTLRALPAHTLVLAVLATAISYLAMIGRDAVTLRFLGAKVPQPLLWIGAAAGSALGNAVGLGVLTGGAVRCRIYGSVGVTPERVARLTVLTSTTFGFALVLLAGLGLIGAGPEIAGMLAVPTPALVGTGLALMGACTALLAWCGPNLPPIRLRRLSMEFPSRRFLLTQVLLVAIDVGGAALALWVLMPATSIGFPGFLAIFVVALLLGVIGHTPGGLGVFEAAMIYALGTSITPAHAVAALLAYRAIYFVLPLLLSATLLAGFEVTAVATRLPASLVRRGAGVAQLLPMFLAAVTFTIGVMLVVSGATPAFGTRLALLQTTLPLWVLEGSQLLASVLGVLLLFVARGLLRRQDAAWWLAISIATVSLALSLAKGLAFFEAGVLAFLILLLAMTRHRFVRPTSLFQDRFTLSWLVSIGIVLAVAFWVFFFAFRNVPYSHDLWWQFAFNERAPRALRATLGAALFGAVVALWQLLRPAAGKVAPPTLEDLQRAAQIIRAQERSDAVLAMMGDKNFVFSPSGKAFLMYAKRGRSWVALHDPVGPAEEWPALISRFVALAHAHAGRAAFYQVRQAALPLYLDAGLKLMKLGEEARIALDGFGLAGPRRTNLRYAVKRGERDGLQVEIAGPAQLARVMPLLHEVSEQWQHGRRASEKGFSVASFDLDYLAVQSVMLVRQRRRPVAFATFMTTDLGTEATVGVMRHDPDASPFAMEFLFTKLALHLQQEGFRTLSLGMAPLSGLTPTPLTSSWHRVGHLLWRFGSRFYNFRGLRSFKSKFHPDWEPRYLAATGTLGPFLTLADLAALTGGKS